MRIDGRMRSLYRRRFCLDCSPFGQHNTSKAPVGSDAVLRKRRRVDSWVRYLRKRRRNLKERLLALRGGKCQDCGYAASTAALEFHHRDAKTKEFGIGNMNGSWARLVAEAEKCDLLCANCHRRRHAESSRLTPARTAAMMKKDRAIEHMGGSCFGCGEVVLPSMFEFHHLNASDKAFGISRDGMNRPWEEILAELAKCVMLCANCHREVHSRVRHIARGISDAEVTAA
jgi:5-methylcytosine-specific restriction endonuclease McrA